MKTIYCDVDNTLVFAKSEFPEYSHLPAVEIGNRTFYVNMAMVEKLKDFVARGHIVHIWSAGGKDWAIQVYSALFDEFKLYGIGECLSKPDWIFDDLQPSMWMPEAEFIPPPSSSVPGLEEAVQLTREQLAEVLGMGFAIGTGGLAGRSMSETIDEIYKKLLDQNNSSC